VRRDRMQPRNKSKGSVRVEMRADRQIVVKDYGAVVNPLVRLYGGMTLRNEARAYKRLSGIPGIPACHGMTPAGSLELDFVAGRHLGLFKRRSVPEHIFEKLERILQDMHSRGVANMDLHRSNVLVSDDGDVHVIDFAHAVIARDPQHPGIIARLAMQLDRYAFSRMKARFVGLAKPVPSGAFGFLYRCMKLLKGFVRTLKRIATQE
jgi:hypothetical protein